MKNVRILSAFVCVTIGTSGAVFAASLRSLARIPRECGSVQFISEKVGWCGGLGAMHQTVNGGVTWQPLQIPVRHLRFPIGNDFDQFQLLGAQEGWVRTQLGLYWTENGGRTWTECPLPLKFPHEGSPQGLVDYVYFATSQIGWGLGRRQVPGDPQKEVIRYRIADEHSIYLPALFRTDDGGRTWTEQAYPDLHLLANSLEFANTADGLSIELNATLYTRDGGHSWKQSRYCPRVNLETLHHAAPGLGTFMGTAAQLLDDEVGWWSVEGDIFRTNDGGETWCQLPAIRYRGKIVPIHELRFVNRKQGWAVPDPMRPWGNTLLPFETKDGGQSWTQVEAPPDARTDGCSIASSNTVFCWGESRLYRLLHD